MVPTKVRSMNLPSVSFRVIAMMIRWCASEPDESQSSLVNQSDHDEHKGLEELLAEKMMTLMEMPHPSAAPL